MRKVLVLAMVVLALAAMAGVAGASPNGGINPWGMRTER